MKSSFSTSLLGLLATVAIAAGCDPLHTGFDDVEAARMYQARTLTVPEHRDGVKVMNWNAKFGGGRIDFFFDCHGDRSLMTEAEVEANLEGLAAVIRELDPDILMMQEIDVASKRAAYVDQVQRLLDLTDLNYAAYASQWHADYVPSDGIGPIDSGNAILSRYPIREATRYALPLIDDQDAVTKYFYLRRNYVDALVDMPGDDLHVVNIHVSAYASGEVKTEQIARFHEHLESLDASGAAFVAGGDLNTLAPGTTVRSDFPDSVCEDEDFIADDYGEEPEQIAYLWDSWTPAIPLVVYQANQDRFFTHTTASDGFWNRKLDYMFTNGAFSNGDVIQSRERGGIDTMPVSDHAPVVATWGAP